MAQWAAMCTETTEQAQQLGRLFVTVRPVTGRGMSDIAEAWLSHMTRMVTRSMDVGGLALAPVHQQVTANAKRLSQIRA